MQVNKLEKEKGYKRIPVSVIIPVRNRPELMIQSLESVLHGWVWPEEILVVTNGSHQDRESDKRAFHTWKADILARNSPARPRAGEGGRTTEPAESARRKADATGSQGAPEASSPSLEILESHPPGPAAARNTGARRATCPYIAFLDSDDTWYPEKLERQWDYLSRRPHLQACHSRETWQKDEKELQVPHRLEPSTGRPLAESLQICLVSASSILMRRSVFLDMGGFDERFASCEDYEFWIRYFLKSSMGCIQEPLVRKRSGDWPQVSSSGLLDLQRLRALTLRASELCSLGMARPLLESAHRKEAILANRNDSVSKKAKRLLQRILRTAEEFEGRTDEPDRAVRSNKEQ